MMLLSRVEDSYLRMPRTDCTAGSYLTYVFVLNEPLVNSGIRKLQEIIYMLLMIGPYGDQESRLIDQ